MKRCPDAVKFKLLMATALLAYPLHSAHAVLEEGCSRSPDRMNMVVQLTRTGQEKISKVAYEAARRSMDESLQLIPTAPDAFGADPKLCNRANIDKVPQDKLMTVCFGFLPEAIWDGSRPNARIDRMEPVQMKLDNLKMRHLELSKTPKISCKNNLCEATADVTQIDLGFDFAVKSVNDSCNQVALQDMKVNLDPQKVRGTPAVVKVRFKLTQNLKQPVQVLWDQSDLQLPVQDIRFTGKSQTSGRNLCNRNKSFQRNALDLGGDLVGKNQYVMNQILSTVKQNVITNFVDQEISEIAKTNGVGYEKTVSAIMPDLRQISNTTSLSKASDDQVSLADSYLREVTSATSVAEIQKIAGKYQPDSKIADFANSFKSMSAGEVQPASQKVANKWQRVADSLDGFSRSTKDPALRDYYNSEARKIRGANTLLSSRQIAQIGIERDDSEKIALIMTAIQANDLQSDIQAKLSACYKCRRFEGAAAADVPFGFENIPHDLAFKTSYQSVNKAFSALQQGGHLDTCMIIGASRACKDALPSDSKIDVRFSSAPEMVWDEANKTFAFRVKGIEVKSQKTQLNYVASGLKTDVYLPGRFEVTNGGTSVRFVPQTQGMKISNTSFQAAKWDPTEILSGVVAWAATKAINIPMVQNRVNGYVASSLTQEIALPVGATLAQVRATPAGFGIYMNLPSDPTILLPKDVPQKTVAAAPLK